MISPCLSAAGLRFWEHPVPAEDLCLAYARPTGILPYLIGVTVSRMVEMRLGGRPLYSGVNGVHRLIMSDTNLVG
jgi:hypothetical protein